VVLVGGDTMGPAISERSFVRRTEGVDGRRSGAGWFVGATVGQAVGGDGSGSARSVRLERLLTVKVDLKVAIVRCAAGSLSQSRMSKAKRSVFVSMSRKMLRSWGSVMGTVPAVAMR
jgi:hypothetical protein